MQKRCRKCDVDKSLDQFPLRKEARDGHGYVCRQCRNADRTAYAVRERERRANDPEFRDRRRSYERSYRARTERRLRSLHYKRTYQVSVEEYDRLFAEQGGCCAICKGKPSRTKHLHVDHCHETGRVRGLLCDSCNLGLGSFKEDPERVTKAADYLRRWRLGPQVSGGDIQQLGVVAELP